MKHLPMLSALLRYEIHDSHGIWIALKQSKVTVFWAAILFYFGQSTCFDPEISSQNNFWTQSGSDEKLNSSGLQTLLRSLSRLELKCHPWWRWSATDYLADCIYDRLTRYWIVQTLLDDKVLICCLPRRRSPTCGLRVVYVFSRSRRWKRLIDPHLGGIWFSTELWRSPCIFLWRFIFSKRSSKEYGFW